jgi:hypothetical protein
MLQNDTRQEIDHYIRVGQSAMGNIEAALRGAGRTFEDIGAALDLACGYGRVLQWLAGRSKSHQSTSKALFHSV